MPLELLKQSINIRQQDLQYQQSDSELNAIAAKLERSDVDISQLNILTALINYLEYKKKNPQQKLFPKQKEALPVDEAKIDELINKLKMGYCAGISPLWAFGKWLAAQPGYQPGKGDDIYWYYATALTLTNTPPNKLTVKEKEDIERFLSVIEGTQHYFEYYTAKDPILGLKEYTSKNDLALILGREDIHEEFGIAGLWTKEQFARLIKEISPSAANKEIRIGSHVHDIFLRIENNKFIFFDPNSRVGEVTFDSAEELVTAIFKANLFDEKKPSPLSLNIFGFDQRRGQYPSPEKLLADIKPAYNTTIDYAKGMDGLMIAARENAPLTSIQYYLQNPDLNINKVDQYNRTALVYAAASGQLETVNALIAAKADVNKIDANEYTALMYAAERGHHQIVQVLLDKGAQIYRSDKNGKTALMLAAENGHEAVVETLLKHPQVVVNQMNLSEKTALMLAAEKGHIGVVRTLIAKGAEVNREGVNNKKTALMLAAENGHQAVMQELLTRGANINQADKNGKTALMLAKEKGHLKVAVEALIATTPLILSKEKRYLHSVVQALIQAGADINQADRNGKTVLMLAAENGQLDVVQELLKRGANLNQADKNGKTVLMLAAENGHLDVVQTLINAKADINQADKNGKTAFMFAAENGELDVLSALIKAQVNITQVDDKGNTALQFAEEKGHLTKVLKTLIDAGVNLNRADSGGKTALMLAAEKGQLTVVKALIVAGADINHADNQGKTALMLATSQHHADMVQMLIDGGADIKLKDNFGKTALAFATNGAINKKIKAAELKEIQTSALAFISATLTQHQWPKETSFKFLGGGSLITLEDKTEIRVPSGIAKMITIIKNDGIDTAEKLKQLKKIASDQLDAKTSGRGKKTRELYSLVSKLNVESLTEEQATMFKQKLKQALDTPRTRHSLKPT